MPIIAGRASAAYGAGFSAVTTVPYAGPYGAYDALATVTVGASSVSTIEFAGIPSNYKHLQLMCLTRNSRSAAGMSATVVMQLNGDTTPQTVNSRYFYSYDASGGGVSYGNSQTNMYVFDNPSANALSNSFGVAKIDIFDYSNPNKLKTVMTRFGGNLNGDGEAGMFSGLWEKTDPIQSITFLHSGGHSFLQYSTIALYGVK